jgi:hypothetical protein
VGISGVKRAGSVHGIFGSKGEAILPTFQMAKSVRTERGEMGARKETVSEGYAATWEHMPSTWASNVG